MFRNFILLPVFVDVPGIYEKLLKIMFEIIWLLYDNYQTNFGGEVIWEA